MGLYYYTMFELSFDFTIKELTNSFHRAMHEILRYKVEPDVKKLYIDDILEGYNVLSNEEKRAKYDFYLEIRTMALSDQLSSTVSLMEKIVYCRSHGQYDKVTTGDSLVVKKSLAKITEELEQNEDIVMYLEQHYCELLDRYDNVKEKYIKK